MIIERRPAYPGKIFVQLEGRDFERFHESGALSWMLAVEEIKALFKYPSEREYSRLLEAWIIADTPENMRLLGAVKDKYFIDKNQINLDLRSRQ